MYVPGHDPSERVIMLLVVSWKVSEWLFVDGSYYAVLAQGLQLAELLVCGRAIGPVQHVRPRLGKHARGSAVDLHDPQHLSCHGHGSGYDLRCCLREYSFAFVSVGYVLSLWLQVTR